MKRRPSRIAPLLITVVIRACLAAFDYASEHRGASPSGCQDAALGCPQGRRPMPKHQIMLILAVAMWAGIVTWEIHNNHPVDHYPVMPADGSAPPLPPEILVRTVPSLPE